MALQISMSSSTGASATYFRIREVSVNRDPSLPLAPLSIQVDGYLDQSSRQSLLVPLLSLSYQTDTTVFTTTNPIADLYTYLLTLPDFSGATNV